MEWFRFYDEVLDDPKVQRLPAALFRDWINVLCLCNRNDPRGVLPSIDDVAFGLRYTSAKAKTTIKKLHEAELLVTDNGVTYPKGWHKRQRVSDNVAKRVAEHRARKADADVTESVTCNVTSNVTSNTPETLPHVRATDTETDTETELTTPSGVVGGANAPATPETKPEKKPKAKRATQIPETWLPSDSTRSWAAGEGFTDDQVDGQILRFVDYWRGKGETRKDWDATFRNWMRNAKEWGHLDQPKANSNRAGSGQLSPSALLASIGDDDEHEPSQENTGDSGTVMAEGHFRRNADTSVGDGDTWPRLRSIAGGGG